MHINRVIDKETAEFLLPYLRRRLSVEDYMKRMKKLTAREYLRAAGIALRATFTDEVNAELENDDECYLFGRCFSIPGKSGTIRPMEAPDHEGDPSLGLLYLDRDSPEEFKDSIDAFSLAFHWWEISFGRAELRPVLLQYSYTLTDKQKKKADKGDTGFLPVNVRYDPVFREAYCDFDEWKLELSTHGGTMEWDPEDVQNIGVMYAALLKAGFPVELHDSEKKLIRREVLDIISGKVDRVKQLREEKELFEKKRKECGKLLFDLFSPMLTEIDEYGEWDTDSDDETDS